MMDTNDIRLRIRNRAGHYPWLCVPFVSLMARARNNKGLTPVSWDVELVIEGFPRYANSFAVTAFEFMQERRVRISHHFHMAGNVIYAARRNIPVLLLIRDPVEAVPSYMLYESADAGVALDYYINFHSRVLPYSDKLCIADFNEVIEDFGAVVERLNRKYGLEYRPFENSEENVRHCFQKCEEYARANQSDADDLDVDRAAYPDAERKKRIEGLREKIEHPKYRSKLEQAKELKRSFATR